MCHYERMDRIECGAWWVNTASARLSFKMSIRMYFRCLSILLAAASSLSFQMAVLWWDGKTPLQIPIVLPSLCFRGNSLLPSGRPSSLSSSHFPLMGSVLFPSHFLFRTVSLFYFQRHFIPTFFCTLIWFSLPVPLCCAHFFKYSTLRVLCYSTRLFLYPGHFHLVPCRSLSQHFTVACLKTESCVLSTRTHSQSHTRSYSDSHIVAKLYTNTLPHTGECNHVNLLDWSRL